jgi:hypothetical protein
MLSPRWLIGITLILVIIGALSNFIDGSPMMTQAQADDVKGMSDHSIVTVQSPSGGVLTYINIASNALKLIGKALLWDYSFFHDVDPVTGADSNSDLQMILTTIRFALLAITVGIVFQMAYLLRQIVTG